MKYSIFTKIVLSLFLLLGTGCSSLMYFPFKGLIYSPDQFQLKPEVVYFQNKENQKIHGWWFPAKLKAKEKAKGTFVFFHGNAENISSHFVSLRWLPDEGYNYFIFDYPGYGSSEGEPNPYVNVMSGIAAMEWVHANKDSSPLIVYGQSMGSIVAMRTVTEVKDRIPIKITIVDGAFSSFQRIARLKMSESWVTWILQPFVYVLLSDRWAPDVEKIAPIPLMVLHGNRDEVIPIREGERIFEDAQSPKWFVNVIGGKHGNTFWIANNKYRQEVLHRIENLKGY